MKNIRALRAPAPSPSEAAVRLGPATITSVDPVALEARLARGGTVVVRSALAFGYEPAVGDEVLVIGGEEGHFVIGVLASQGRAVLAFPGGLDVRAVGGVLRLAGDEGVSIESPEVAVRAGKLRMVAEAATMRFGSLAKRVRELFSVAAGQTHTVVEGSSFTQSKSATIQTEENVSINGKAIHLG